MKRLLVAGIAALAVVLGLVVTTGVASAAPTWAPCAPGFHHGPGGACVADGTGTGNGGPRGGRGAHGGFGGGWRPNAGLPWGGPTLYGHQLWLNAQLGLDICGDTSYDGFLSRNSVHRSDIDRYLGRTRWQTLYSSDCNSGLAVLPGGLSLVNGDLLNLNLLGLSGAGTVNVCSYSDWNDFNSRLGGRWGGRWNSVRGHFGGNAFDEFRQLRVNAHCTVVGVPSSTTIIEPQQTVTETAAPDTTAPSADDGASNPQPLASPLPANAPVKAPNDGGIEINAVLAQARVA